MDRARVLKQINTDYEQYINADTNIQQLYGRLQKGRATQPDALKFAKLSGSELADSVIANMGEEIAIEDAMAIIPEALRTNHEYVTSYYMRLQTKLDEKAKIGLKPLSASFDADRAAGLAEAAAVSSSDVVKTQIMNFSMHTIDESMQMTAESRNNAGLEVLVSRKYDDVGVHNRKDPCQWCLDRECSEIPYQEAYEMGVFERHPGCECLITYTNNRGDTTYQAAKGQWYESSEEALEKRKNYGL